MSIAAGPLAGIRVVTLAEQFPGPFATLILGDLGADVIQVERPQGGDPSRVFPGFYMALNRGKRSVAIDLKNADGLAACRRLIGTADVLLEGFRPGVMSRIGLGYEELAQRHPQLVYVSVSGFGQNGPQRDLPAHDLTYQALSGLLDTASSEPNVPNLALADLFAGMFTAIAAVSGTLAARTTGHGSYYDVSMFDTLLTAAATKLVPQANSLPTDTLGLDPGYGLFATSDGVWVSLSIAFEDHFWRSLCNALDMPDEAEFSAPQRVEHRERLRSEIAERVIAKPAEHWDAVLPAQGVPYGRLNDAGALLTDPHVLARRMIQSITTSDGEEMFVRQPLLVNGVAHGPRRGVPHLGEHTEEVLTEAGVTPVVISRLVARLMTQRRRQGAILTD